MTVYIIWGKKARAIKCPKCGTCNQVSAQKDNLLLRCSKCSIDFSYLEKGIELRKLEVKSK